MPKPHKDRQEHTHLSDTDVEPLNFMGIVWKLDISKFESQRFTKIHFSGIRGNYQFLFV